MSSTVLRRTAAISAVIAFAAVTTVLLLADRSVSLIEPARALVIDFGRAIEDTYRIDLIDRSDIPADTEQFGHAALWGTNMILFGWVLRRRVPLAMTALLVAGASVIFEAAQPLLSMNRRSEASDAVANLTGIAGAVIMLAALFWATRKPSTLSTST